MRRRRRRRCRRAPTLLAANFFIGLGLARSLVYVVHSLALISLLIISANDETKSIQIVHKYRRHGENGARIPRVCGMC